MRSLASTRLVEKQEEEEQQQQQQRSPGGRAALGGGGSTGSLVDHVHLHLHVRATDERRRGQHSTAGRASAAVDRCRTVHVHEQERS